MLVQGREWFANDWRSAQVEPQLRKPMKTETFFGMSTRAGALRSPMAATGLRRPSAAAAPIRTSPLQELKLRLLRPLLAVTSDPDLCRRLCGAANQAAEQAWETPHPLLFFPCLFEEMTAAILDAVPLTVEMLEPELALAAA